MEFKLKGSYYGKITCKEYKEYDIKDCELLDYCYNSNKLNVSKKLDKQEVYLYH